MNKYKIEKVMNDRWAVWYMPFPKRKGSRIGVYKIIDLYKTTRETRFAFRYKPREDQSQEQSDLAILTNCIRNFYKQKVYMGSKFENRGNRSSNAA